MKYDALNAPV